MTIKPIKFTPEVLLSAPRRSPGVPNCTGELVLYTVSTYCFKTHKKNLQIRYHDVPGEASHLLVEESTVSEPTWIGEREFVFFKSRDRGCTILYVQNVDTKDHIEELRCFNGTLSNLKAKPLSPDRVAIMCSALTTPSGDMFSPSSAKAPYSSGKAYSSLFVRHWDTWSSENQPWLWYGVLERHDGRWELHPAGLTNLLAGTELHCPVPPFGGTGDFDMAGNGVAFVARDPELSPAMYTKSDVYYVPVESWSEKTGGRPRAVKTEGLEGYSVSPVFSPDGTKIAFARMKSRQYESDKTRLLLVDVRDLDGAEEFYRTDDGKGGWDARPESIGWSADGETLFVTAERHARNLLWKLPSSPQRATLLPEPIFTDGSVVDFHTLGSSGLLLVSSNSRIEPSCYSTVDPSQGSSSRNILSSSSKNGRSLGLSASQCSEFWFTGAAGYPVHALVMKPSEASLEQNKGKRYPLAMLIHGGPQGAWLDSWSTRWNPAVFAEQGYAVVMPNFTASTGYGQAHVDGVTEQWGGVPYQDLVRCFDHVAGAMGSEVDVGRAVALGASYGGYMINWIQGHELGRRFKALVCHDGVYSTQNQWSTEELFFPLHDFGGTLWERRASYERWDPARFAGEWSTPQLVVHNELDYRLPISEGLAMFNVLQARGVPSRFLMFPDENHWVLKPENSLVWHGEVLAWINRYSGVDGGERTVVVGSSAGAGQGA